MRLASFNVENLFERPKLMNLATWAEGEDALAAYATFTALAQRPVYSDADKAGMLEALETLRVLVRTQAGNLRLQKNSRKAWALLRENRGDFLREPKQGSVEIVAGGRGAWIGWVELIKESVDEIATRMTAKVIVEANADVIGLIESEDRPSLVRFNEALMDSAYAHVMLVDGNDLRGIDVALMTKPGFDIAAIHSHVDDPDPDRPGRRLFSRDCPVYRVHTPAGNVLWVLVNHFKSQSWTSGDPDPLRRRQAARVLEIYAALRQDGAEHVAVIGDLNKGPPPKYPSLEPLLADGTPLKDSAANPYFDPGKRPGTFQSCSERNRLDYILLSPELEARMTAGGIDRSGLWGTPSNKNPPKAWDIFPEITSAHHGASDHALIWVDLEV